jgi:non-ribosomal peptide synthetase component E (peptide arylation enzyme)
LRRFDVILASQEIIKKWTQAGAWGNRTLIDYFHENVKKEPDKICIADPPNRETLMGIKPERLSYLEFSKAVDATAEALLVKGFGKDDIILVQLPNCWELAMLYLAITRAGALISPLPMQWRSSELEFIAGLTEAKGIITVESFGAFNHRKMAEKVRSRHPSIRDIILLPEIRQMAQGIRKGDLDQIRVDPNAIFTLCWSSGTEAEPKGCPLSHNNWIAQCRLNFENAPIKPGDNLITAGPLVNMASIGGIYVPWLVGGGKMVLHHPFEGLTFVRQLISEEIHYTLLVPAAVNGLLNHPEADRFDLSKMRAITIGGAPPSLWSVQSLKRRWGIEFANIWGQNEGTGNMSGPGHIPDPEKRLDHFPFYAEGTKWAGQANGVCKYISMKLVDPDGRRVIKREGDIGELWYKGPNVIPGYFKRPDLTARAFDSEGFFRTGDLFQLKDEDCVGFFDRIKDIIIRGGFNISAQEVENLALSHPRVQDAAAVAMPDEILGERTCLYLVPKPGQTLTLAEMKAFMTEKGLAVYKIPERLEITPVIPRNPVGKVLKKVLREDIRKKMAPRENH